MFDLFLVIGFDVNVQVIVLIVLMDYVLQFCLVFDGVVWIGDCCWDLKFQFGEMLMLFEGVIEVVVVFKKFVDFDVVQFFFGCGMVCFDMCNFDQMVVLFGLKKFVVLFVDMYDKFIDFVFVI